MTSRWGNGFTGLLAVLTVALTIVMAGCSTTPRVAVDYDTSYSFADKRSYAFVEAPASAGGDDLLKQRLISALSTELTARGWRQVAKDEAQLWLSFVVTSESKQDVRMYQSYNAFFAYHRCYLCDPSPIWLTDAYVVDYEEKTLTVDFIDPASNSLKWRGHTRSSLSEDEEIRLTVAERVARANEAVAAVLAHFPPPQESDSAVTDSAR